MDKKCERGTFKILVDKRLGMVIKIWKDSKTLKVFSTTMTKGVGKVTRSNGKESITVKSPNEIITYQQHMGGADRRDQHRLMRAGFANEAHF